MRILGGLYKGRLLSAGSDLSIRPMTNRNKESIFAILDDFFVGKRVLDLFCGSGSLGLEALSRGAEHLTFVEKEKSSIQVLTKNINLLKIDPAKIKIEMSDVLHYLRNEKMKFKLIFADPPFQYKYLQMLVKMIFKNQLLEVNGALILHHEISNLLPEVSSFYKLVKQNKAGRSLISILTQENNNV